MTALIIGSAGKKQTAVDDKYKTHTVMKHEHCAKAKINKQIKNERKTMEVLSLAIHTSKWVIQYIYVYLYIMLVKSSFHFEIIIKLLNI